MTIEKSTLINADPGSPGTQIVADLFRMHCKYCFSFN